MSFSTDEQYLGGVQWPDRVAEKGYTNNHAQGRDYSRIFVPTKTTDISVC